ncbi:amidohydrolase [Phaeocystidibacter luteus]|uniref:Omega-amidase YafV n=1 Tax=Phaeocystidibacter luteus TaxID=911197 RepID=A0A6N6RJR6_9FLAO|nr:amidohydrolase [Phaeocystidibacter luteus]KAB2813977.1 amidohydrolase [Phaeocystidibacter luteus]
MNDLKVSLVQTALHWEDAKANRAHFDSLLASVEDVDIIFLPEMFSTGFSMKPEELAEPMGGPTVSWMMAQAAAKSAVIAGSVIILEEGNYFNRLIWAEPNGIVKSYDKRHRFTYAGEDEHYTAGADRPTWELKGWKVRPQVCYDLRFPVWSRNDNDYDLIFYVANWPERRNYPWKTLLRARAIENMACVVGLNRVGEDGNGVAHSGDSVILNALGEPIAEATPHQEEVITAVLSKEELQSTRERFRFLNDRDQFDIKV